MQAMFLEVSGVVNIPTLRVPSVLVRDPAGHFRGMSSVTAIWPYLGHLGSVLDRASGGSATTFDCMLGTSLWS